MTRQGRPVAGYHPIRCGLQSVLSPCPIRARFRPATWTQCHTEGLSGLRRILLRLLGDAADTVKVRIGSEQSEKNLKSTSLVTVGYGDSGMPLGALGILGPTRMDYAGSMAAVGAVARYVGRFITESAQ